jgi:arsenate reductase
MAEAFAKKYGISATSAGTMPARQLNPTVVQAMQEKGFDLSSNTPNMLTVEIIERADLVVTMGCSVEQVCPKPIVTQMQKKLIDWHLDDPKGQPVEVVRTIRDEIEERVKKLASSG